MDTTAGSTLARTAWMSVGWASTLRLGKYFSTTVCWRPLPTHRPARAPTRAATTAVVPTTQIQLRRVRVWTTRCGGGIGGHGGTGAGP